MVILSLCRGIKYSFYATIKTMKKHLNHTIHLLTKHPHRIKHILFILIGFFVLVGGIFFIWLGSLDIPDFKAFDERKVEKSTKIYDRTGEIVLYNIHENYKRTVIPFEEMGTNIKNATVAVEDSEFYQHNGIRIKAIMRAVWANIKSGSGSQGGSTITQQVIKNSLLTTEKTLPRKFKEWVLALKIEQVLTKEQILATYLNENPYGGSIYGVQEASQAFFKKNPKDLTLAESAYLAAIPRAPTFYSPYGKNMDKLEERKNFVLSRMKELSFITEEEFNQAKSEVIVFQPQELVGITAPHFVFYIREYLESQYGAERVEEGGLKVVTTLDVDIQKKAEEVALKNALKNEKDFNASNTAVVILEPSTGHILAMVGSRNYFDKEIDGKFNVATASRQPGSSFKPLVYAAAFEKGYTPETILFDVKTEFNSGCNAYGKAYGGTSQKNCYTPDNYNGVFHGPMTLRAALGGSINIPAVKLLYLVGVKDALKKAKDMGIKTLTDADRYGLTLVLGGGEVSPLDMAGAYGVLANNGLKNKPEGILQVFDSTGELIEEYEKEEEVVLPKNVALQVSDILSDNAARTPTFGANSTLNVSPEVAVKTGTTNSNRDAWMIGYSTSAVVAVWSGNNDNTPMKKGSTVSGPTFNELMRYTLTKYKPGQLEEPQQAEGYDSLLPVLRGKWQGGETYTIDTISGLLATEFTPAETREERVTGGVHTILYWVNKENPRGPQKENPTGDSLFNNWETTVQDYCMKNGCAGSSGPAPTEYDNVHTPENQPKIEISSPDQGDSFNKNEEIEVKVDSDGTYPLKKVDYYLNGNFLGTRTTTPFNFTFIPDELGEVQQSNELKVVGYDSVYNSKEETILLTIQ